MKKLMLLFDDAKVHEKTDSIKFLQRIGFLFQRICCLWAYRNKKAKNRLAPRFYFQTHCLHGTHWLLDD